MQYLKTLVFISLPITLVMTPAAQAQLSWRVSIKVVMDEGNNRFAEYCVDGTNDGDPCDPDADCPGGACIDWVCVDGTQDGNGCNIDRECPGGECIGDLSTDAEITAKINTANAILSNRGPADVPGTEERGYLLDLVDIIELTGLPTPPSSVKACANDPSKYCTSNADCPGSTCVQVTHWHDAPIKAEVRTAIQTAAQASPAAKVLWGWNDDAINVYILGSDGSGTAWYNQSVLLGQDLSSPNTPFHEIGHFLELNHTHGGGGVSPDCVSGHDDGVADTLLDNCGDSCGHACGCWCKDDIANWNFPVQCGGPCDYAELSSSNQRRVDQVYYNLMCYRGRRDVITPGQLDRMTDFTNGTAHAITDGRTRFVDVNATGAVHTGSSERPYREFSIGLFAAAPGDIVLLRTGIYDEVMTINQNVTLRASLGDAVIGTAP